MDVKLEEKAKQDAIRHAEEFRIKHKIPQEEWDKAEEIFNAYVKELFIAAWKEWEDANGTVKVGSKAQQAIPQKVQRRRPPKGK